MIEDTLAGIVDTANAHISTVTRIPVVELFGALAKEVRRERKGLMRRGRAIRDTNMHSHVYWYDSINELRSIVCSEMIELPMSVLALCALGYNNHGLVGWTRPRFPMRPLFYRTIWVNKGETKESD